MAHTKDIELERARAEAVDSPTAWFAMLEHARRVGDFKAAAEAQRQLERLGVRVRFGRPVAEVAAT